MGTRGPTVDIVDYYTQWGTCVYEVGGVNWILLKHMTGGIGVFLFFIQKHSMIKPNFDCNFACFNGDGNKLFPLLISVFANVSPFLQFASKTYIQHQKMQFTWGQKQSKHKNKNLQKEMKA